MFSVTRSGITGSQAAAAMRDVPARVIPYAAATALTRSVKAGQKAVIDRMPAVFQNPTRYTLAATRIEPATKDKLTARVAVKDQSANGTRPESYLLPEVEGGARSEKRFERALRYQGILSRGQQAMPGEGMDLDASGNVSARQVSQILSLLKKTRGGVGYKGQKKGRGKKLKNELFVGRPVNGSGINARPRPGQPEGIYRREGRRLRKLFIFTKPGTYRERLNFEGIVAPVVQSRFKAEFELAVEAMLRKSR